MRHSLEPELVYTYIPEIDQSELPKFDEFDRIDNANLLAYGLTQRLTARFDHAGEDPTYRELVYLRVSQAYDLTDEFRHQRFQDLRVEMTLLPTEWLSLQSDTRLDVDTCNWTNVTTVGKVADKQGNSVKLLYNYKPEQDDPEKDIEYVEGALTVAFLNPVYLDYQQRYDLTSDRQLEQMVGIEYRHQCWGAKLTYRDRDRGRDLDSDRSIMLTFTMRGIGSVGGVGTSSLGGF